jgi:NAD(P)H dehydrogenase (quinone)
MNRRGLLKGVSVATASAFPLLAASSSQAQVSTSLPTVLITYHSVTGNTEKMAQGMAEGAKAVPGTNVVLKRVSDVAADDLLSCDAAMVGSPVYFANMSGEVKTFLDDWSLKFGLFQDRKMRNKVGAAFATGGFVSGGIDTTIQGILAAMLNNQMIVVNGAGASAITGPGSPGIDEKELAGARDWGKRVAEVATIVKRGATRAQ